MRQHLHVPMKTAAIALIAFVLMVALWSDSSALTGGRNWRGHIDSLPANGVEGEWVVASRTFLVTEATQCHDSHEVFGAGVCVEVAYSGEAEP